MKIHGCGKFLWKCSSCSARISFSPHWKGSHQKDFFIRINLIAHNQGGNILGAKVMEGLLYGNQLVFHARMRKINNMQQKITFPCLIQCAFKTFNQMMW